MEIQIRLATPDDAPAVRALSQQLGYPISESEMKKNLDGVIQSQDAAVYVASENNKVIGWIYLFKKFDLVTGMLFEIGGLVIDENYRNRGIGKKLVQEANNWCTSSGGSKLRVRSQLKRKDAHRFYLNLGFAETKEQKVFDLVINKK